MLLFDNFFDLFSELSSYILFKSKSLQSVSFCIISFASSLVNNFVPYELFLFHFLPILLHIFPLFGFELYCVIFAIGLSISFLLLLTCGSSLFSDFSSSLLTCGSVLSSGFSFFKVVCICFCNKFAIPL